MRLGEKSATQHRAVEEPARADDPPDPGPPHFAGKETVPLRDPAALVLERERAERVRTVVGARPRWQARLAGVPRRAAVGSLLVAATIGTVVLLLSDGDRRSSGTAPSHPKPTASRSATPHARSSTTPPRPHPRPRLRRHPAPAADRGAGWRREVHRGRGAARQAAASRDRRDAASGQTGSEPGAAPPADAEAAATTTVVPIEPEVAEPTAAESTPEPVEEPPPAPDPTSAPPAQTSGGAAPPAPGPRRTPVESEFGFER
jgi:hypothetical protein